MKIEKLTKTYISKEETVHALDNVSLEIPDNGLVIINGESGCGKTTLLFAIAGLSEADSGRITWRETDICSLTERELDEFRNLNLGFVFQNFNLFEEKTVENNLKPVLRMAHCDTNENLHIKQVLEYVGLGGYEKRKITELSAGQKQRVAIARAIVKEPRIILADEPTGNLDSKNSIMIWEMLKKLSAQKLVIVVTHDPQSAQQYADYIVKLHDGKVVLAQANNCCGESMLTIKIGTNSLNFDKKHAEELYDALVKAGDQEDSFVQVTTSYKETGIQHEQENIADNNKYHARRVTIRNCLAFAIDNTKNRMLRHITAVIILSLTLLLAYAMLTVFRFDKYKALSSYLAEYSFKYISPVKTVQYLDAFNEMHISTYKSGKEYYSSMKRFFNDSDLIGATEKESLYNSTGEICEYVTMLYVSGSYDCLIEGTIPQNDFEIAITDLTAFKLGLKEPIGSTIIWNGMKYRITGVIDTDYEDYDYLAKKKTYTLSEIGLYKEEHEYCIALVSVDVKQRMLKETTMISQSFCDFRDINRMSLYQSRTLNYGVTGKREIELLLGRLPANENEVIVADYLLDNTVIKESDILNEHKNQVFTFRNIYDEKYQRVYSNIINYYDIFPDGIKIVGVFKTNETLPDVIISEQAWNNLLTEYDSIYYDRFYLRINSLKSDYVEVLKALNLFIDEPVAQEMDSISETISKIKQFIALAFIILLAISIIMMINCIGLSIRDEARKIGIMRTLGMNRLDTYLVFLIEEAILLCASFLCSLGAIVVLLGYFTDWFRGLHKENPYSLFTINPVWVLLLFLFISVIGIITMSIPLADFAEKKPVELLNS